jgi:hypothetical protein
MGRSMGRPVDRQIRALVGPQDWFPHHGVCVASTRRPIAVAIAGQDHRKAQPHGRHRGQAAPRFARNGQPLVFAAPAMKTDTPFALRDYRHCAPCQREALDNATHNRSRVL